MTVRARVHAGSYCWEDRPSLLPASGKSESSGYHVLVLALATATIYANLPIYAYVLNAGLLPKLMYFGLVILMTPLLFMQRRLLTAYVVSPFVLWAGCLVLLNLIHLTGLPQGGDVGGAYLIDVRMDAQRALILTRIQALLFTIVLGFVLYTCTKRSWLATAAVLALLIPCAVLVDFMLPGLWYPVETSGAVLGRAAAMFINPNMAGEAILHVFLLACVVTPARYRGPLFVLAGAAIVTTFSRSAIIAWALLFAFLVYQGSLSKSTMLITALAGAIAFAYLGQFEHYLLSRSELEDASDNILARLDFFSDINFDDDSSEERASVLKAGWELFLQNPVFGAGAGATHFWSHRGSTHNQLVQLAAEYGLFGIGLWCWMVLNLWRGRFFEERGLQMATVFLFVFMSMFAHHMFDSPSYWLTTFALASARAGPSCAFRRGMTGPGRGTRNAASTDRATLAWSYETMRGLKQPGWVSR